MGGCFDWVGGWLTDQYPFMSADVLIEWALGWQINLGSQGYSLKDITIDGVFGSSHRFSSLNYVSIHFNDYSKKIWYFLNFIQNLKHQNFHISFQAF